MDAPPLGLGMAECLRRLAATRDAGAWACVVEDLGGTLYRTCRRILGDEACAEDAVQETLLQVRDRAGRFRAPEAHPDAAARAWILRLAVNTALQMLRRRSREDRHVERRAMERSAESSNAGGAAEAQAERSERLEAVNRALPHLPEAERLPLLLHYYAGLDYAALAEALGCPVNTAKTRVHRGIERLRERLAALGLLLPVADLDRLLEGPGVQDGAAVLSTAQAQRLRGLLESNGCPALDGRALNEGVRTMTKIACAGLVVLLAAVLWTTQGNGADAPNAGQPIVAKAGGETAPAGPGTKAEAEAANGLKVTLSADKNSIVAGDRLTLTVKLENVTDKPMTVRVGNPAGAMGRSVFERGDAIRLVATDGSLQAALPYEVLIGIGPGVDFITLAPKSAATFSCLLKFTRLEVKARFAEWTKEKAGQELLGFAFGRPTRDNPSSPEFFLETGAAGKIRLAVAHEVAGQPAEKLRKNAYRGTLNPKAAYWEGKARSNDVEIEVAEAPAVPPAPIAAPPAEPDKPVTDAEKRALGDAINAFAVDLYGKLAAKPGNLFVSPYSVSTALAMTYGGARGNTAAEMAKVLHLDALGERAHDVCGALIADLNAEKGPDGKARGFQLAVANRLFGLKGYPFLAPFLVLTKDAYGAPLEAVDFKRDVEGVRKHINSWVEERTRTRIKDLIPEGALTADARLVLVNAIYFKGDWAVKFDEKATSAQPFHLDGGKTVQAQLMAQTGRFGYREIDGRLQVLELPYAGGELSMVVLLPDAKWGLAGLEKDLTPANLAVWTAGAGTELVSVTLPRFKMTWGTERLKGTLIPMGMKDAFSPADARFGGMTSAERLCIDEVLHKTFVEVNEEGTEAAGATAVIMAPGSAAEPEPPKVFRADRPFLYAIRHKASGAILFLGRVTDPTKG